MEISRNTEYLDSPKVRDMLTAISLILIVKTYLGSLMRGYMGQDIMDHLTCVI